MPDSHRAQNEQKSLPLATTNQKYLYNPPLPVLFHTRAQRNLGNARKLLQPYVDMNLGTLDTASFNAAILNIIEVVGDIKPEITIGKEVDKLKENALSRLTRIKKALDTGDQQNDKLKDTLIGLGCKPPKPKSSRCFSCCC